MPETRDDEDLDEIMVDEAMIRPARNILATVRYNC